MAENDGSLPPAPRPWDFQQKTAEIADSLTASLGEAEKRRGSQLLRVLEGMIRGCLLDQKAFRAAAADESGTGDAWLAMAIVFLMTAVGPYLIYFTVPGISQLFTIVLMAGIQVLSMVVGAALISWLAPSIAGVKASFGQILRPLAYAQSIGVLGFLGPISMILGLWRMVTSLAAIRAVLGCDPVKAAVLLIIGGIGSVIAVMALTPLIIAGQFF